MVDNYSKRVGLNLYAYLFIYYGCHSMRSVLNMEPFILHAISSIICIQGYNQTWSHAPSYIFTSSMRILRVVCGIYTTCFDQSGLNIWYNYDLIANIQ